MPAVQFQRGGSPQLIEIAPVHETLALVIASSAEKCLPACSRVVLSLSSAWSDVVRKPNRMPPWIPGLPSTSGTLQAARLGSFQNPRVALEGEAQGSSNASGAPALKNAY